MCWAKSLEILRKSGEDAYVLGEISGEIVVLRYNPSDGTKPFTVVQTVKADPHDAEGSADIHLSPDGRFLYASHRLKGDGISIFSVAPEGTLRLTLIVKVLIFPAS